MKATIVETQKWHRLDATGYAILMKKYAYACLHLNFNAWHNNYKHNMALTDIVLIYTHY